LVLLSLVRIFSGEINVKCLHKWAWQYHGGTNFERTGMESVTTSYDYDAPMDEFGEIQQSKWGHLKDLHATLKLCELALMTVNTIPTPISLGPSQEVIIIQSKLLLKLL